MMAQLHELGSKWETNYLRYICIIAVFQKGLITMNFPLYFYTRYLQPDKTNEFHSSLPGKQRPSAWSGAPHGGGGLTELGNSSDHDRTAWADGRTREPHHHYTPETRGWLLPPREEVFWPSIQPGVWLYWPQHGPLPAPGHLLSPQWQGLRLQHRWWQRLHPISHRRHGKSETLYIKKHLLVASV